MSLSPRAAITLVADELFPQWHKEADRLDRIDWWYRWRQEPVPMPRRATPEMRRLAELSRVPWLGLVVSAVAQCLYVDNYRSARDVEELESGPWLTWLANAFDQRQVPLHRATLAYGYAFVTILPGEDQQGKRSVLRGVSPRKAYAAYADPADDDWPMYLLRVDRQPRGAFLLRLYDEVDLHYLGMDHSTAKPVYISRETHGAGVCPAVRYANMLDLDGRADGEVEPFIPAAARINKTSFDRMLAQHFSSWKIRTVAGMAKPDDEESANRKKLELRQDDILVAEDSDTKFGTLDETSLTGFIDGWRADVEALASVTQTPTHALTGQLINLSAEAIAESRAGLTQKVFERQRSFGRSHVQALRLAAQLEGNVDDAYDLTARVTWQDMEVRSLSQAVDALGKAAQMLKIPPDQLWGRIPGVERSDVDEWRAASERSDPLIRMTEELRNQTL